MMTEQEVLARLLPLLREVTGVPDERIRLDSLLMDDLGAESLDLLDLSFLIEEAFGVTIAGDEFERRARAQMPGLVYERDGILTAEAIGELRRALPEVPPHRIQPAHHVGRCHDARGHDEIAICCWSPLPLGEG